MHTRREDCSSGVAGSQQKRRCKLTSREVCLTDNPQNVPRFRYFEKNPHNSLEKTNNAQTIGGLRREEHVLVKSCAV